MTASFTSKTGKKKIVWFEIVDGIIEILSINFTPVTSIARELFIYNYVMDCVNLYDYAREGEFEYQLMDYENIAI